MRSLLFSIVLVIFLLPTAAYADTDLYGMDLSLDGEDVYNEAVNESVSGRLSLNPMSLLNRLTDDLIGEVRECAGDVMILFLMAAISGIIAAVSKSFESRGAGEAAFFACFTLMSAAAIRCFSTALTYGTDVTRSMTDFITKLSPLLMLMIAASGGTVSATAFQPVISGAVYVVSIIIDKCIVPLAAFSAVLAIAGNISGDMQLTQLCRLVKSLAKWIMTAVTTIFSAVTAIYGLSSPSLDAIGGKTLKFAVGSLVPVVGGFLSDTLETVVSGTRLMKNSVGTAGIIAVCAICAMPVLKITAIQLMLKVASAAAEPLTDKRISGMMWEMSESVTTVFAVVTMTAVMFIINISLMLAATNHIGI